MQKPQCSRKTTVKICNVWPIGRIAPRYRTEPNRSAEKQNACMACMACECMAERVY